MFPPAWSGFLTRHDALRVGAAGVTAAALPVPASAKSGSAKAKSVIVLWMAGGVTHHDSFDPKPRSRFAGR